jgi:sugar lactone lactonase YvrE
MRLRLTRVISGKGSAPDRFAGALRGLAVDGDGLIYAVGDRQLKIFDADGKLKRRWPTTKLGHCAAVDEKGHIHVGQDGRVEQFDAAGALIATFGDAGRLGKVTEIAFSGEHVLLADAASRCIRRYDRSGAWLNDIGADNNTRGFLIPNGRLEFAVDREGVIHAINPAKHRVERYLPTGELLGHFGRFGMQRPEDFPGCCNPTNLALTGSGHVVVTEKAPPRLKVYDDRGQLLAMAESKAFDPNCKNMDVAVDCLGRIYVADTVRLQICVFQDEDGASVAAQSRRRASWKTAGEIAG